MEKVSVTEADLIEALRAAHSESLGGNGAMTVQELQDAMDVGAGVVRKRLLALHREGRLEVVRRRVTRIDGQAAVVPAYRILPE